MPRIRAASVKEHRAAQRQNLLATARKILTEAGAPALKFGELADRAGLARPTVYEYFATRDELLMALMDEAFDAWQRELQRALAGKTASDAVIEAFFNAHLRLVKRGQHGVQALLGTTELSAAAQRSVAQRHRQILALLEPAIAQLVNADMELCVNLVRGALKPAMDQVVAGKAIGSTARQVTAFLVAGLRAL